MLVHHIPELHNLQQDVSLGHRSVDAGDLANCMWRNCFYKQISEFRAALKRHSLRLGGAAIVQEREKLHLAKLTQALLAFLSDSVSFYQKMVVEVSLLLTRQILLHYFINEHHYSGGESGQNSSSSEESFHG
jgi:hypothetical protein